MKKQRSFISNAKAINLVNEENNITKIIRYLVDKSLYKYLSKSFIFLLLIIEKNVFINLMLN